MTDRVAIVVDDGIATGATTRAALRATRARNPKLLVLAVPVAPKASLVAMQGEADRIVCLETPEPFEAIGLYYSDFHQISNQEVIETLAQFRAPAELPISIRSGVAKAVGARRPRSTSPIPTRPMRSRWSCLGWTRRTSTSSFPKAAHNLPIVPVKAYALHGASC